MPRLVIRVAHECVTWKPNERFPSYLLHEQVNPLKSINEGARSMIDQSFLASSSFGVVRMSSISTAPANTANAL